MPFNVIAPVMDRLLAQGWSAYQRRAHSNDRSEEIAQSLCATEVNVVAYLAESSMTVGDLVGLQVGDILQTAKPVQQEIILQVEGQNKFAGQLGRNKDRVAVKVTRLAEVEEPL